MTFYTGIGSRNCPPKILDFMTTIAQRLQEKKYTLRSGGAEGADTAFEKGAGSNKEIYLPWKKFNDNKSSLYSVPETAIKIVKGMHPQWDKCTQATKLLHSRNVLQIIGQDFHTYSQFVICWTKNQNKGGTAIALKIASKFGIPIYNLAIKSDREKMIEQMKAVKTPNLI